MIWLYRILFIPILVILMPFYLKRMFKRGGYGQGFWERLGLQKALPPVKTGNKRLWLHAVSVGEVQSIGQLLHRLHQTGGWDVVLTCTTSTALQVAKRNFGAYTTAIRPFPIDFWLSSLGAWRAIRPDLVVLTDTELWPEHLTQACNRGVPVVLINGRISDRSFKRYTHFHTVSKWLMRHLKLVLTATQQDYSRFIALGADPAITHRIGNIKFDVAMDKALSAQQREQLRYELGFGAASEHKAPLVLLGSSTWPNEEALLIEIVDKAREAGLDARLLLVPRHMERREQIVPHLEQGSHPWHLRSHAVQAPHSVIIYVADTTGELRRLSYAADLVFIGKSLPPNEGGQTPIEAAALGLPIVYGPKMNNFRDICRELEAAGGAIRAQDAAEVRQILLELMVQPNKRQQLGEAARRYHSLHCGTTERVLAELQSLRA